ncbi:hypothetical protein VR46_01615, partial [Streptomyces sp. NRRL S-444]
TPLDLTSALDARCIRVPAATTDKFWLSARTVGNPRYEPGTLMMVVDASGKYLCSQGGVSCRVTGSTSYVAVVLASGYQDKPIHANVDTWKAATTAGWAPECTANRISADGFPARSGTLTESSSAYCAVLDMKPDQAFKVVGTSSADNVNGPDLSLLGTADWDAYTPQLNCQSTLGTFGARCASSSNAPAGQAVLILSPERAATRIDWSMQGTCDSGCTPAPTADPTAISPATSPAGTQSQAVVRGTGLTLGTKMKLALNGQDKTFMQPVSVNAEGTALTVRVDTNGLEPGAYDVVLDGVGYTGGVPSHGYLPKAYTVTAASSAGKGRFVPITPSRF